MYETMILVLHIFNIATYIWIDNVSCLIGYMYDLMLLVILYHYIFQLMIIIVYVETDNTFTHFFNLLLVFDLAKKFRSYWLLNNLINKLEFLYFILKSSLVPLKNFMTLKHCYKYSFIKQCTGMHYLNFFRLIQVYMYIM